jgi:multiple sugar transport system substrate-binding protein
MALRVALVGGPMYDALYRVLGDEVEIVVHADHPTLNRRVAELLDAGERIDVLSTHSKYAPSQAQWLCPLDVDVTALAPKAVELCRWRGEQVCVPRNIDVRVLWHRVDAVEQPPATWDDVVASKGSFGFPGRESGLFGTFFELVVAAGGALFDARARPTIVSDAAVAAVDTLCALGAKAPDDLPSWHYDDVDAALLDGRVDMAAAWPGGYGAIRASDGYERLDVAPYPGRVSYAGAHAWAIPITSGDVPGATALVERLIGAEASAADAAAGTVCAHMDVFAAVHPADDKDARRLAITRDTIAHAMITYPPLARFPEVEDAGWAALNAALRGQLDAKAAVHEIQRAAEEALRAS